MINEKKLIEHCSLTLSSLKTANLFTVRFVDIVSLKKDISFWSDKFADSGVKITLLRTSNNSALIYLYREDMLIKDMADPSAKKILLQYGYNDFNVAKVLKRLSSRLCEYEEFPHEIGLFLGYPPKDVEGFICNGGKNCTLCRYWKVYGEKEEALQRFARYDKCKRIYKNLWQAGRDIMQLTVKKQSVA